MNLPMDIQFLHCGSCTFPDALFQKGGRWRRRCFPALVTYFEHPEHGGVLFDTGYACHFKKATSRFPEVIYALTTPVQFEENQSAAAQLRRRGVAPEDVRWIVLSHLHADHLAGLKDFPHAEIVLHKECLDAIQGLSRFALLRQGVLPDLFPEDFAQRVKAIGAGAFADTTPFDGLHGHDLWGDGSAYLIELPGHAPGHCGLLMGDLFVVADACWVLDELDEAFRRHSVASHILHDAQLYDETITRLRKLKKQYPHLQIVTCHSPNLPDYL